MKEVDYLMFYPKKLNNGANIRVIAPSRSLSMISQDCINRAIKRLEKDFKFNVTFSKHCYEKNEFVSSSIEHRIEDLHEAFEDKKIDGILTAIGGYNTNQLLEYIDFDLIKKNPKVFCGFSDITCLAHAITSQTGMVTYSGPHFSTFGMEKGLEYTVDYFRRCLLLKEKYEIIPSDTFSDDPWYLNQKNRKFIRNLGWNVIHDIPPEGIQGQLYGGNLTALTSLQGTAYYPKINRSILFIEDTEAISPCNFDRLLQTLLIQSNFKSIKALLIGRFQLRSGMNENLLKEIIHIKKKLQGIPVISNVDFGHTTPICTYPIGGKVSLSKKMGKICLTIKERE